MTDDQEARKKAQERLIIDLEKRIEEALCNHDQCGRTMTPGVWRCVYCGYFITDDELFGPDSDDKSYVLSEN